MTGPVTTEALVASLREANERFAKAEIAHQQVTAERDRLRVACLAVQKSIARFPGSVHDRAMAKIDKALGVVPSDFVDPDEAELARLRAEGEAKDRALTEIAADAAQGARCTYRASFKAWFAHIEDAAHTALARAATAREG